MYHVYCYYDHVVVVVFFVYSVCFALMMMRVLGGVDMTT